MPGRFQSRELATFNKSISDGAARLYIGLDEYARETGKCWPSQKTLADRLGCSVREVQRRLRELIAANLCVCSRKWTGGPNTYTLHHATGRSLPHDQMVATHATGRSPLLNKTMNQEYPPKPPQAGGIDILQLEGAYPGCTACPACGGSQSTGRSEKRRVACVWCQGRGFMWPRRSDERMAG